MKRWEVDPVTSQRDFLAHVATKGRQGVNKPLYTAQYFALLEAMARNETIPVDQIP
jgi:hypothetical protein